MEKLHNHTRKWLHFILAILLLFIKQLFLNLILFDYTVYYKCATSYVHKDFHFTPSIYSWFDQAMWTRMLISKFSFLFVDEFIGMNKTYHN